MVAGMLRLARPSDWIKNVFVLIPIPFAMASQDALRLAPLLPALLLGLLGFCLINSAVYTLNDVLDVETDRLHSRKKHRPVAAGDVSIRVATIQIVVLLAAGMVLGRATSIMLSSYSTIALFVGYFLLNTAYSAGAKHIALLDVFLLSSGFVIRVLLGCALVKVTPSAWLLLCTSSLALFLCFAKRRADLVAGLDLSHRPSLRGYNRSFLEQAMTISAGVALLAYALYCIESAIMIETRKMASMPFVAYGILNYLRLANLDNIGGSPVEVAYHSRPSQVCAIGWIVAVVWSLGLSWADAVALIGVDR